MNWKPDPEATHWWPGEFVTDSWAEIKRAERAWRERHA
jgi:hypothetical protein